MDERQDEKHLEQTTQQLLHGLRVAVLAIATTILLLPISFVRNLGVYRPLWPQLLAYGTMMAIVLIEAVLVIRRRPWSRARWVLLAAAFGADLLSRAYLPPGHTVTSADWIFGVLGWMGVILLLDRSLLYLIGFLLLHELCTLGKVLLAGPATRDVLLNLVAGSLGTIGYPLASGIAALALRRVAKTADRASRQAAEIRTAGAVEAEVHTHRQQRFANLYETAAPLLQGLADQSLDPNDARVQRACAIEAARMRRLFAETDAVPDPLVHELRQSADVAERKGVLVEVETRGSWRSPPLAIRRALTEATVAAISTASSRARITIVGTSHLLSVNVVADCAAIDKYVADGSPVRITSISEDGMTWVEAQWVTS